MRLLILDLMSPGPASALLAEPEACEADEDWPACSELSMLVRAEESAVASDELTVPAETSD